MSCINMRVINCLLKIKQIFQEHSQFENKILPILVSMVLFLVCLLFKTFLNILNGLMGFNTYVVVSLVGSHTYIPYNIVW